MGYRRITDRPPVVAVITKLKFNTSACPAEHCSRGRIIRYSCKTNASFLLHSDSTMIIFALGMVITVGRTVLREPSSTPL